MIDQRTYRQAPVRGGVIGSALILVAAAVGYRLELWPAAMIDTVNGLTSWLAHPVATPAWLLVLLSLCTGFVLLAVAARLLVSRFSVQGWRNYNSDALLGVRWQWIYNANEQVANLVSCCPSCEHEVHAEPAPEGQGALFRCAQCSHQFVVRGHHPDELKATAVRMIEQKLRMHAWPGPAAPQDRR